MQNIQKHHKSAEILKNNEENSQELGDLAVVNEDHEEKVKNYYEKNSVGEAKNGLEDESFFTVINRARKAAHTVSEKDIWGSD
jgi:lipase chaperone LimK